MSWNATVDRLKAQAQQYGLANDYVTAKVLYEAVDEIERIARERDEARAQADRLAKAVAAATALIENHDAWLARQDVMVLDIDSEWTRLVDALRAALAALPTKEDDDGT